MNVYRIIILVFLIVDAVLLARSERNAFIQEPNSQYRCRFYNKGLRWFDMAFVFIATRTGEKSAGDRNDMTWVMTVMNKQMHVSNANSVPQLHKSP